MLSQNDQICKLDLTTHKLLQNNLKEDEDKDGDEEEDEAAASREGEQVKLYKNLTRICVVVRICWILKCPSAYHSVKCRFYSTNTRCKY